MSRHFRFINKSKQSKIFILKDLCTRLEDGTDRYKLRAIVESIHDIFLINYFARLIALHNVVVFKYDIFLISKVAVEWPRGVVPG